MDFTAKEWERYTRHIQLADFGTAGQVALKNSHVLIVGAGGLGSPVSLYLAAAGVGTISIVDGDTVDLSNLQRQILFNENDIGLSKAEIAKNKLQALNSDITVNAITEALSLDNAESLIRGVDLVLDCTDNFTARYLINDVCLNQDKAWLFASIHQYSGQCALFAPGNACFRCLFPDHPENIEDCNTAGVLGVLPGILGTIQANEAIRYLSKQDSALENNLLLVETKDMSFRKIKLNKNTNCLCADRDAFEVKASLDPSACETIVSDKDISPAQFNEYKNNPDYLIVDVRSKVEHSAFNIGGINIPLDQIKSRWQELEKNKTIIFYCQTGKRSTQASHLLLERDYQCLTLSAGLIHFLKSQDTVKTYEHQ